MLTEKDVLDVLDNSINGGYYNSFIDLGHVYSYLIDCRLNLFRGGDERWAIAAEKLGYNPRSSAILLDIYYFGNCLVNLENYEGQTNNSYSILPIDWENFQETIDGEILKASAKYWLVRGRKLPLSHSKQEYINAGIKLKEYEPNEISAEEVGRFMVIRHSQLFRATDAELYKSVPSDLKKILVLDEWYHRDYSPLYEQHLTKEQIDITYHLSKQHYGEQNFMDYDSFVIQYEQEEKRKYEESFKEWQESKPSAYETWQQLAKVIVNRDASYYKPTLEPNSHWKFWPDSGSM